MHTQPIVSEILKAATPRMHQTRRGISGDAYETHRVKRADRLLSNRHLNEERLALYTLLARRVIGTTTRPLVSVDWSNLDLGKTRFLLRASVAVDGRAFTVHEEVHPRERFMKRAVEHQFLVRLSAVLGPSSRPIIISDAGFHNPWRRAVLALGWDYIARIRGRVMLATAEHDDWQQARSLFKQASGQPKVLTQTRISQATALDSQFVIVKQKRRGRHDLNSYGKRTAGHHSQQQARPQREPWLLATSLDLSTRGAVKQVIRAYKTRMQIEEAFRDLKSERYGLGFEASRAKRVKRIEVLLFIALIALYIAWIIGLCVQAARHHRRYQANTVRTHRVLSFVYLGRRAWHDTGQPLNAQHYQQAVDSLAACVKTHSQGF